MGHLISAGLPKCYKYPDVNVRALSNYERAMIKLAHKDTMIDVVGDQALVEEAVDYCFSKKIIGVDFETSGLNHFRDRIVLVQVGDLDRQYLIWADTVDVFPLQEVFADPSIVKAGHNLKFDALMWQVRYGREARWQNPADSMICEQVLTCGLFGTGDDNVGMTLRMTDMESCVRRWYGWDIPKDDNIRTGWDLVDPLTWKKPGEDDQTAKERRYYAADDVCHPLHLLKKQKPWLVKFGLGGTINREHKFLPVLVETEWWGLKIDHDKWLALAEEAEEKTRVARRKLDQIFDVEVTVRIEEDGTTSIERDRLYTSHQQLKDMIHEYMLKHHNVYTIITNEHLHKALLAGQQINPARLDKLFEKKLVPNPKKPGSKMQVGYPSMNDLIEKLYPKYKEYLPENHVLLPDTESKTLRLYKYIWETDPFDRDPELPTNIGLPPELVDPITDFRLYSKRMGTYGRNWFERLEDDGRVHPTFFQTALSTGRLSSTPNVQNPPADSRYREAFVPEDGYMFVGGDWSQIEPRVIAQLSQDFTYMRVFHSEYPGTPGFRKWCNGVTEPLDLYVEVGKNVGIIPRHFRVADCKLVEGSGIKPKEEGLKGRKQAKIIVLGLGYGTGVPKFWLTLIHDTGEHHYKTYAQELYYGFWDSVPSVKEMLDKLSYLTNPKESPRKVYHPTVDCLVTYSESLAGRKRFFHPENPTWWTMGRNHPIQATAGGDILKDASIALAHWIWENDIDGFIVNYIHDELLLEVREDQAEAVKEKMSEVMKAAGERYCTDVPTPATAYVEKFWLKD